MIEEKYKELEAEKEAAERKSRDIERGQDDRAPKWMGLVRFSWFYRFFLSIIPESITFYTR